MQQGETRPEGGTQRAGTRIAALRMPPLVPTAAESYVVLYGVPGAPVVTPEAALDLLDGLLLLESDLRAIVSNDEEQRVEEHRLRAT